jgi:hypothetical protein
MLAKVVVNEPRQNRPVRKFKKQFVSGFEDVFMSARLDVIMRDRDSYC